jgi:coproporphyrinogen III oxidase-like Fe-S oxidoreductase
MNYDLMFLYNSSIIKKMFIKSIPKNIYVHLPFCLKKCSFCAFPVHAIGSNNEHHHEMMDLYLKSLIK